MNNKRVLFIDISIIVVALIIIALILFNTIFYNYKNKLNNYLNNYYMSEENNIDDINKLINRYKNNSNRTNNINKLLSEFIDNKLNEFNTTYDSNESLDNNKNKITDKITFICSNINENMDIKENYNHYIKTIDSLYESKVNYLNAINLFNNNNYSDAYESFKNVIESDCYYDDTTKKIDLCFDSEVNNIQADINNLNTLTEESSLYDKLDVYKQIFNYLIDKKNNIKFDLTKSKTYSILFNEYANKLENVYIGLAKYLASDNNYDEALNTLLDGVSLLSKGNISVNNLTDLRDEYLKMQPISLTTIEGIKEGENFKEELATFGKDNANYSRSLTAYNLSKKSSITYNVNSEYKYLSFTSSITKEVNEKNKNYGRIKIYADNKVIFDSKNITINYKVTNNKLDISNINSIKIEYNISNGSNTNKNNIAVFIIGNPMLEKY